MTIKMNQKFSRQQQKMQKKTVARLQSYFMQQGNENSPM